MNTQLPISTISYNTVEYLDSVLSKLLNTGKIEFFCYIQHKGEYDEETKLTDKDHIHLFVIPNGRINTVDLGKLFIEPCADIKPLKCINWVTSKADDFILYNTHDKYYLLSKFLVRQYHYEFSDWVFSEEMTFRNMWVDAYNTSGYAKYRNMYKYFESGGRLHDLVKAGAVPPNQIEYYKDFAKMVTVLVN